MYGSPFLYTAIDDCDPESPLHPVCIHGVRCIRHRDNIRWSGIGKNPGWVAVRDPVTAQQIQRALGQGHIAVFGTFPGTDVEHHSGAVNVTHLEIKPFLPAQTAGVNGCQASTVMPAAYCAQDPAYLLQAEHDRKFFLPGRSYQVEDGPDLLERELVEEFDSAQGNLKRGCRDTPFILQVQEVLA